MRGCFVRALLGRGALCVVASLSRVDAFTASMFVGRLLTDIFSPSTPNLFYNFYEVFFSTQNTTSLLYDPLLPFFRLAEREPQVRKKLGLVLSDFFAWTHGRELDIRTYRHEIAWFVGEAILRQGLQQAQIGQLCVGNCETRDFTLLCFWRPRPRRVETIDSRIRKQDFSNRGTAIALGRVTRFRLKWRSLSADAGRMVSHTEVILGPDLPGGKSDRR